MQRHVENGKYSSWNAQVSEAAFHPVMAFSCVYFDCLLKVVQTDLPLEDVRVKD
jgi:hypothetical protein